MTARSKITDALVTKLKLINGKTPYTTNIFGNVYKGIAFWDSINDYPSIYLSIGMETREYHPGDFKWGFLNITARVFVKETDPQARLEKVLEDIETVLDANNNVEYDTGKEIVEIRILSIQTDEGILSPYGAGEILFQVRYDL